MGKVAKKEAPKALVTKKINGEKNGETRTVRAKRFPKSYETQVLGRKLKGRKNKHSEHKRKLRANITPGTVLIILSGPQKGKRVVFLKQLDSGLLLVTGPFKLNGCPLRRVHQKLVISTQTKLDISAVKLPERLNDEYFKRVCLKKPKHQDGEIFDTKQEEYSVSDVRKEDQVAVDKQIATAIRANPDKKFLLGYLGAMFSLTNKQYPHKMIF